MVDVTVSDHFQQQVRPDTLNQMIEIHPVEVDAATRRMPLMTADEATRLKSEAHRLTSGSLTLGFGELGASCGTLQDEVDRDTTAERRACLWRLRAAYVERREWQRSNA